MIIRVTVNDNDFYYDIMGFMRSMWNFRENKSLSVSEQIDAHKKQRIDEAIKGGANG